MEKAKSLVIAAGGNLAEIHPPGAGAQKWKISKNGIVRSDDSGKYFPESDNSGKSFQNNVAKSYNRKAKSLVILVGENLAEIHPLGADGRIMAKSQKLGSSEVMILGKYFLKSDDYGKYFSNNVVKS